MGKQAKIKAARKAQKRAPVGAFYVPYDEEGNAWLSEELFVRADNIQAWAQDKPYVALADGGFYIRPDLFVVDSETLTDV